jgi:Amidase
MPLATTDLWRMSALELAAAIRSRQTSSQEVIESHLRRIEMVNPSINAVTVVLGKQALQAAKTADRIVASRGELPPLHGVPFTVKENIDLVGTPTSGAQGASGRVSAVGQSHRRADAGCWGNPDRPHQVIGPRTCEDLCLDAAAALEDRVGVITPIDPR